MAVAGLDQGYQTLMDKRKFIMATFQTTRPQPLGAITLYRATNVIENVVAKIDTWNKARKTKAELSKLTERELSDIGLTRGDINNLF